MYILETKDLKVYFHQKDRTVKALDGADVFLTRRITTALAGESGCGKTTLARAILRFLHPGAGTILFEGKDILLRKNLPVVKKNIQIVFQNPFLSLDPRFKVWDSLYEVLRSFVKTNKKKAAETISRSLEDVELTRDILSRYPHQLSGGQSQRVCIARALITGAPLIILDEPTSSLDITTASKIVKLLQRLRKDKGITFLFISHNLKLIRKVSQYSFIMYYGKIVESGPTDLVYGNPLHPYTKLLKEASLLQLKSFKEPDLPSGGCPFLPRCPKAKKECSLSVVKREVEAGHFVFCNLYK